MMRKEIIIEGKVFDLGLKGLEDATKSCRLVGQEMELEVAGRVFQVGVLRQDKAVAFHEVGQTILRNIVFHRFVALGLWWPPVKVLSCFAYS